MGNRRAMEGARAWERRMLKAAREGLFLLLASCLLLLQPVSAQGVQGQLVSVGWLQQNLGRPELLLIDASPAQLHGEGHIAGAVNADLFSYGAQEVALAEMQRRFQAWGVSPGRKIVLYDQGGTFWATRLHFDLLHYGFPANDLFILDGGLAKWRSAGGAVTKERTPVPTPGTFRVTRVDDDVRVRLPEFLTASGDRKNHALVEALDAGWHFGETPFFDRPGHIPFGIMLPSEDFFNADKTFKSAQEIERMVTYLGIRREQQIHTYCGGGIAASVPFFALKFILNYPKVKMFQESQLGWARDERELPFWTYDAPNLMRDTAWLKTWSGRMMRMYGISQVSVVDVRPADIFLQGHLPFAVNVPAEVFRTHRDQPARLAEILGQAGVNVAHEAVVVSEGGVNEGAALAFLALERLGQKKVSIFMDSLERWAELGFAVDRGPTAVGPRTSPADLSIAQTVYPVNAQGGLLLADARSARGLYPTVYIASGKSAPAKAMDGPVLHLPYTSLVNADGTPRAAKDIWKALVKAGVPRYATIFCISEQPGEAAANYYLLKLMGFPDVRVAAI